MFNQRSTSILGCALATLCLTLSPPLASAAGYTLLHDAANKVVTMADGNSNLVLRLDFNHRCVLDRVSVRGRQVAAPGAGAWSGIRLSNQWFTTCSNIPTPKVVLARNTVTLSQIRYGGPAMQVNETWKFTLHSNNITWQITRAYPAGGTLEDTAFPGWDFQTMNTWTGGLLDNGGVAWNKYLDTPNASYATHAASVTFWNRDHGDCLRITTPNHFNSVNPINSVNPSGHHPPSSTPPSPATALRFTRQPSGLHTVVFSVSDTELQPKHDLRRFHRSRQDLWAPFPVSPGEITVTCTLQAAGYDQLCNRGTFRGLNGRSIRELLNTIGRYGVIDRHILGANGWRTGFVCLHEQWFSQIGLALDDPDYLANCAATYDYERDHAILPDGRVKSRWCYGAGDAQPGTYDSLGYYEAQWGCLLDSQPCFVICVAELFDLTGDRAWLSRQKTACERALDYLLRRDTDGNGLVEMMTDSHTAQKGSDWIDIIWASYENALVNAELYYALERWAGAEELLGDASHAAAYRAKAARLKTAFNLTTDRGGFWDPQNQWYAYWRDKDGSVHGNNLVTPVNFAAISYGLCDDPARRDAILNRMESEMQKENLFFWPLNFLPYQPGEGHANNFPFPKYENGDIFLSWGELAVRAYAQTDPAIAVKYVRNVLDRYDRDGLSFQRYQRKSQCGAGEDILAGNCMTIVGLYRNIYGLQPKYNRLYLEPHLTPELNGTQLRYTLRRRLFLINLNTSSSAMTADDFTVRHSGPFALNVKGQTAEFFPGSRNTPALSLTRSRPAPVQIQIESWPTGSLAPRRWVESCAGSRVTLRHRVSDIPPFALCQLVREGRVLGTFHADASGTIQFKTSLSPAKPQRFQLLSQ